MKQSLLTTLCLASVVGCVPPNAVSMGQEQGISSLPRLMGDTWQFFSQTQDKRAGYFKDKKAVEAYYKPLYQALKRRNPMTDAKAAAERGQRLLLGMY